MSVEGSSWSPQEASSSSRSSQTDKCVLSLFIKDREAGRQSQDMGLERVGFMACLPSCPSL